MAVRPRAGSGDEEAWIRTDRAKWMEDDADDNDIVGQQQAWRDVSAVEGEQRVWRSRMGSGVALVMCQSEHERLCDEHNNGTKESSCSPLRFNSGHDKKATTSAPSKSVPIMDIEFKSHHIHREESQRRGVWRANNGQREVLS